MHSEDIGSAAASCRTPLPLFEQDPLDADSPGDARLSVTRRELVRVALVATEAASHFTREGVDIDPMAWLLAPRRMFDGRAALDACRSREDCLRAVLLHGLSIGVDADPEDLDDLLSADDSHGAGEVGSAEDEIFMFRASDACRDVPRLWTSCVSSRWGQGAVQSFEALIAENRSAAEVRIRDRYGPAFAGEFEFVEGFDPSLPLVEALVSPALADMLKQVALDPASPLAAGLVVSVQQRFAA